MRGGTHYYNQAHKALNDIGILTDHGATGPDLAIVSPDRQVWYRVARWPRRVSHAQVLVDYTTRPEQLGGETFGVLVLDIDQECRVVPAHTQGGQA